VALDTFLSHQVAKKFTQNVGPNQKPHVFFPDHVMSNKMTKKGKKNYLKIIIINK